MCSKSCLLISQRLRHVWMLLGKFSKLVNFNLATILTPQSFIVIVLAVEVHHWRKDEKFHCSRRSSKPFRFNKEHVKESDWAPRDLEQWMMFEILIGLELLTTARSQQQKQTKTEFYLPLFLTSLQSFVVPSDVKNSGFFRVDWRFSSLTDWSNISSLLGVPDGS